MPLFQFEKCSCVSYTICILDGFFSEMVTLSPPRLKQALAYESMTFISKAKQEPGISCIPLKNIALLSLKLVQGFERNLLWCSFLDIA